jgi:hypothetical protein
MKTSNIVATSAPASDVAPADALVVDDPFGRLPQLTSTG